ncbi:MAG: class I SAM-dependent DNA methyltransferase [Chloroflexota bacterium]
MNLDILNPRKALNKAFLKAKPRRSDIDRFKNNLIKLLGKIDEIEREENQKNHIRDFLRETYYKDTNEVNTKDTIDLAIHLGKTNRDPVGVIIEAKRPGNRSEMISQYNPNAKALQELLLYYLRERISNKNLEIKYLVATNIFEWYVFDAQDFEKRFAQNKNLIKLFNDFEARRLSGTSTDFFYSEIARPALEALEGPLPCAWFDIRDYEAALENDDKEDDSELIALFKLLSAEHLLKLPFANDSNTLDKSFYAELLHIIGLTEVKSGSKKQIVRKKAGERDYASLIENAIYKIDDRKIAKLRKTGKFGETDEEIQFNAALELTITWVNRILFLKLLEAQLIKYNGGSRDYAFLNKEKIKGYDDLDALFFNALAKKPEDRNEQDRKRFAGAPYLNSSLFEVTELEDECFTIAALRDEALPLHPSSALKNSPRFRDAKSLPALEYFFEFLEAYDFSSEGDERVQEDDKRLINASVLGLIFEKINGYRDGSFFTPGFITMYMCRETIRRAVLQKFKEAKGWDCPDLPALYNKIEDRDEANRIINSIKICDPAVGSGHFLVSALNEIIAVKSELRVLLDRDGRRLKEYTVEVVNDELVIADDDGKLFEYKPTSQEAQRVQMALFHEKQTIIENCLFGVDINPNSVKICRLRLWIELLKNAYYRPGTRELETLPNIDINIKCGNSLISRYALDADIKEALKGIKWRVSDYREAIMSYRNAPTKAEKRAMESLIETIKGAFETEVAANDTRVKGLRDINDKVYKMQSEQVLFERTKAQQAVWEKELNKLTADRLKFEAQLEEIKSGKIYENAFEWRFEFPEVLDDNGDFVGFDVVIGNPPYIRQEGIKSLKSYLEANYNVYTSAADMYVYFIELGDRLLKDDGNFTYITPNKWMRATYGKILRRFLKLKKIEFIIDFGDLPVFEEATTYPCIINFKKVENKEAFVIADVKTLSFSKSMTNYIDEIKNYVDKSELEEEGWTLNNSNVTMILNKIRNCGKPLGSVVNNNAFYGIKTGLSDAFVIDTDTRNQLISQDPASTNLIKPFLLGRNIRAYAKPQISQWLIMIPKGYSIKSNLYPETYVVNEPVPRYGSMPDEEAWNWFQQKHPSLAKHLLTYKDRAESRRDQGDFWWELRACDYYREFDRPKIMYQVFQVKPCFIYDKEGLFCNNSMWIIPNNNIGLVALLNSKMGWWLISKYCTAIQNGYQLIWDYFKQIPIPVALLEDSEELESYAKSIIDMKEQDPNANTLALEREIDKLVYELYGLTEEEIRVVDPDYDPIKYSKRILSIGGEGESKTLYYLGEKAERPYVIKGRTIFDEEDLDGIVIPDKYFATFEEAFAYFKGYSIWPLAIEIYDDDLRAKLEPERLAALKEYEERRWGRREEGE